MIVPDGLQQNRGWFENRGHCEGGGRERGSGGATCIAGVFRGCGGELQGCGESEGEKEVAEHGGWM